VHSVLQHITLEGHDADARRITIAEHLQNASTASALQLSDHETEQLVELIDRSLRSNLGAIGDHQLLQDFTQGNLLPELGFDFPISPTLSDGERLQQRVEQLLQLLRKHLSDDPVCQTWLKTLSARDMDLAGMVTGSIDAVLGWKS
jgi:ATP-dependent exoDNAse (exonuclease V) beta subunit